MLFFVTGNEGKFREASALAAKLGVELRHSRIPYLEIQADDLSDIAKVGVQQAFGILKAPCFVEDSGIFIQALRGFPGPYSNFVFRTIGNQGIL
ncbi:MAG: non-canonical purine NTP pyrophosphatase, partial [Candidatus Hadarchaeales archaeon]